MSSTNRDITYCAFPYLFPLYAVSSPKSTKIVYPDGNIINCESALPTLNTWTSKFFDCVKIINNRVIRTNFIYFYILIFCEKKQKGIKNKEK